jgi:hypothetical protein
MANVLIKNEQRREYERQVAQSFGIDSRRATPEQREQAECIAAKTREICKDNHIKGGY